MTSRAKKVLLHVLPKASTCAFLYDMRSFNFYGPVSVCLVVRGRKSPESPLFGASHGNETPALRKQGYRRSEHCHSAYSE